MISDKERQFLDAVRIFSKTNRYYGMMPRWVADSCSEAVVRKAFEAGCVAYSSIDDPEAPALEGMILTDKGLELLGTQ